MTNQTQVAKRSNMEILKGTLRAPSVQEQFERVLKDNAETFIASLIDLYGTDSHLQSCKPQDVAKEALKAAALKLPISKGLGFAYLVPYKNKAGMTPTFQIGYKGYIQLAMRTGQYKVINADRVYEGELKSAEKLTGHIDLSGEKKSNKIVGYFAYFELLNGFSKTLYMTKDEVEAHAKRYSKSYGYATSPWKTNFHEMAMKTMIRNLLSHYGYLSVEMIGAFEKDGGSEIEDAMNERAGANSENLSMEDADYEEVGEPEAQVENKEQQQEQEPQKKEKEEEKEKSAPGF